MGDGSRKPTDRIGFFEGFEGYQSPTDDDYVVVLTSGLVVLDTNVLLNLYRFAEEPRTDLLTVLDRLGDCMWVPHQAAHEFFRNREQTILTRHNIHTTAVKDLEKPVQAMKDVLSRWTKAVGLPQRRRTELHSILDEAFGTIKTFITDDQDQSPSGARDTNKDPILAKLTGLLNGRVGPPLPQADMALALQEAERRRQNRLPPGYEDGDKEGGGAGDYLVWEQTIVEAERRDVDVLFITSDVKEDWWRKVQNIPLGPRVELVQELRQRTGRRLLMLQPQDLLRIAGSSLDVVVRASSVEDIQDTAQVDIGVTNSRHDHAKLYLETALGSLLPNGVRLSQRRDTTLRDWDIVVSDADRPVALIWFYDPVKPFNDFATDSVLSTATAKVASIQGRYGSATPYLVCVADLTTLARRFDMEPIEAWQRRDDRHISEERAASAFEAQLPKLISAGFDHVDCVVNGSVRGFEQLDAVAERVRDHFASASRHTTGGL